MPVLLWGCYFKSDVGLYSTKNVKTHSMNYKSAALESGAGGKTQCQLKPIILSLTVW